MLKYSVVTALMILGSTEVKAQYPAGSYVNQVQFTPNQNQPHYQTFEEAKRQAQQNGYGGYKVDNNNYVIQTAPTQDYMKTTSVNGQTLESMGGSTTSSSTSTNGSANKNRFKKDSQAEIHARRSATRNPTGASQSRAKTYERNNNVKYGTRK